MVDLDLLPSSKITTVVFLVESPLSAYNNKRFGFDFLNQIGFNVQVFDLSNLLLSKSFIQEQSFKSTSTYSIHKIISYAELNQKISDLAQQAIFIDTIVHLSDLTFRTEKIFRLLKRNKAKYYVLYYGSMPMSESRTSLRQKLKKLFSPKKILAYLERNFLFLLRKIIPLYPLPEKVFSANADFLIVKKFVSQHQYPTNKIIPIHSLDYDSYLEYKRNRIAQPILEKICIFLDEMATDHSDFERFNIPSLNREKYFESMRRFFDFVEKNTGVRVVIAAHPSAEYPPDAQLFGGREIIKNKTLELIDKSQFTMVHASTSVGFSILLNKPIMVIKTSEMCSHDHYTRTIDLLAESLGVEAVNIDDSEALAQFSFNYSQWPKNRFDHFRFKHIQSKKLNDLTTWEIVTQEIKSEKNQPVFLS